MTMSPEIDAKREKMKDLLTYGSMKTDKHMRDTEAHFNTEYYEPAEKSFNSYILRSKFNTEKRPYKAKTKLDINKEFLVSGEGVIPENM